MPADRVSELATRCQSFEDVRKQRVLTRRPAATDDTLAMLTLGGEHNTLLPEIVRYVREEVARQLSCLSYLPTTEHTTERLAPAIQQVIQEQVSEALPSASDLCCCYCKSTATSTFVESSTCASTNDA